MMGVEFVDEPGSEAPTIAKRIVAEARIRGTVSGGGRDQ